MVANVLGGENAVLGSLVSWRVTLETLLAFKAFSRLVVLSSLSVVWPTSPSRQRDGSIECPRSAQPSQGGPRFGGSRSGAPAASWVLSSVEKDPLTSSKLSLGSKPRIGKRRYTAHLW